VSLRRGLRFGLLAAAGVLVTLAVIAAVAALALRLHPRANVPWVEFSIGPASGDGTSINPGAIRASGMTVKAMIATAFDVPSVRVMGPPWLDRTRYSVTAVAAAAHAFRGMLRQELEKRLRLETHVEPRPFDVFVLTATSHVRLIDSRRSAPGTWIQWRTARLADASSERIAEALQIVLGKPVIDETGLRGSYDLTLDWDEDPVASLTSFVEHRLGLRLSPGRRDVEVLIVDSARRDAALLLLAQAGRLSRQAPHSIRSRLARALAVR
jgi:uncharacterized protein (TIGR03435 family)